LAHLANLAIDFFDENVTVFDAVYAYDLGIYNMTPDPDYQIRGVIQPATDAVLLSLPEGQRAQVPLTLHSRAKLKISAPGLDSKNSFIRYQGQVYKAISLGNWSTRQIWRYGLEMVLSQGGR